MLILLCRITQIICKLKFKAAGLLRLCRHFALYYVMQEKRCRDKGICPAYSFTGLYKKKQARTKSCLFQNLHIIVLSESCLNRYLFALRIKIMPCCSVLPYLSADNVCKRSFLRECRSPLLLLFEHWEPKMFWLFCLSGLQYCLT